MRFHLLGLALWSFLFATPSFTSPSDVLYIQKLTADFAINLDLKNFNKISEIEFIPTATYDPGDRQPATGIPAIKNILGEVIQNATTRTSLTTQSISLGPPFDDQGAASTASAITYAVITNFGQRDAEGKAFTIYGSFEDKLIKTTDFANYGGWKFSARLFAPFSRIGDLSVLPRQTGN